MTARSLAIRAAARQPHEPQRVRRPSTCSGGRTVKIRSRRRDALNRALGPIRTGRIVHFAGDGDPLRGLDDRARKGVFLPRACTARAPPVAADARRAAARDRQPSAARPWSRRRAIQSARALRSVTDRCVRCSARWRRANRDNTGLRSARACCQATVERDRHA